jgi:hypothetical protein
MDNFVALVSLFGSTGGVNDSLLPRVKSVSDLSGDCALSVDIRSSGGVGALDVRTILLVLALSETSSRGFLAVVIPSVVY